MEDETDVEGGEELAGGVVNAHSQWQARLKINVQFTLFKSPESRSTVWKTTERKARLSVFFFFLETLSEELRGWGRGREAWLTHGKTPPGFTTEAREEKDSTTPFSPTIHFKQDETRRPCSDKWFMSVLEDQIGAKLHPLHNNS